MPETTLKLSDPAVMRALREIPTMQRWEILRRAKRAMSVAEVASAAQASLESTQRSLDALVAARLAEIQPASSRHRRTTYRTAVARLVLSWSRSDPADTAASRELAELMQEYSRKVQDNATRRPGYEQFGADNYTGCNSALLLDEDALRVRDSFRAAYAMLAEADQRARESAKTAHAKPYHVSFNLLRLWAPEPQMAEYFVIEETRHEHERRLIEGGASRTLSRRELEIARLLANGLSRPKIAAKLGLAQSTVASISKMVYRKLGVNSRTQLADRMRIV
jgi:DNA-binding CsgD family transcriptional regulator